MLRCPPSSRCPRARASRIERLGRPRRHRRIDHEIDDVAAVGSSLKIGSCAAAGGALRERSSAPTRQRGDERVGGTARRREEANHRVGPGTFLTELAWPKPSSGASGALGSASPGISVDDERVEWRPAVSGNVTVQVPLRGSRTIGVFDRSQPLKSPTSEDRRRLAVQRTRTSRPCRRNRVRAAEQPGAAAQHRPWPTVLTDTPVSQVDPPKHRCQRDPQRRDR